MAEIRNNHLGCMKPVVNNGMSTTNLNWWNRRISGTHQQYVRRKQIRRLVGDSSWWGFHSPIWKVVKQVGPRNAEPWNKWSDMGPPLIHGWVKVHPTVTAVDFSGRWAVRGPITSWTFDGFLDCQDEIVLPTIGSKSGDSCRGLYLGPLTSSSLRIYLEPGSIVTWCSRQLGATGSKYVRNWKIRVSFTMPVIIFTIKFWKLDNLFDPNKPCCDLFCK